MTMREIIFRGKLPSGAWIEGDLRQYPSGAKAIKSTDFASTMEVDPRTVGQYTGLTDKNGTRIFEGDIVLVKDCGYGEIRYCGSGFALGFGCGFCVSEKYEREVIGNIHDNPELLEVRHG